MVLAAESQVSPAQESSESLDGSRLVNELEGLAADISSLPSALRSRLKFEFFLCLFFLSCLLFFEGLNLLGVLAGPEGSLAPVVNITFGLVTLSFQ